jgi:hypothetical protein
MTCKKTIEALKDRYSGVIFFRAAQNPKWKDQWRWRVVDKSAWETLARIHPFLITKKDDADKLLAHYVSRRSGNRQSTEQRQSGAGPTK